jgi:LPS-assembly protein
MVKVLSTSLVLGLSSMLLTVAGVGTASAQQGVPGFDNAVSEHQERIGEKHFKLTGQVELKRTDVEIYADAVEIFTDQDRAVATGNVLIVQTGNRIAADSADFNTRTKLGTFYKAYGFATIKPPVARPGAVAPPPVSSQETDVYFQGEMIEKIGPKKYRISDGGFTTCVQPTPRWELHAGVTVLNIDHYTTLRNAIFSVKGVPMLYTPFLYYPTKKDDRATGFLIPTYGTTTLRGQSIHNAFFWVLDRSQDLTFTHDWYSKTGQGVGSEYRYNFGPASNGNLRASFLDDHATSYVQDDGSVLQEPGDHSYEIHGAANQTLPFGLRARGRIDYFSSVTAMQSLNMNYTSAYQNQRSFGGNLVGAWPDYSLNVTLDHTDYFSTSTASSTSGSWPRVSFARNERLIPGTPLYFSVGGEYASLLRNSEDTSPTTPSSFNEDVTRLDFTPQVRFPFKKWQWFTVNSTASWRDTYYTRSLSAPDPITGATNAIDDPLNRRFFTLDTQIVGPVFNRIWDTPDNGYAEKFKHTVEPFLNISRTSSIDNFNQIIQIDGTDTIVGGSTSYNWGVNNRFYAKRPGEAGRPSFAREILDVSVSQTYYTNSLASQYDPRYTSLVTNTAPVSNFSPILINVRGMPTNDVSATASIEIDSRYLAVRQISAGGSYNWSGRVQSNLSWSKQGFIPELTGFNDKTALSQAVNAQTNVHTKDNGLGGIYSFSYDVTQGKMLNQRVSGFYNSQCCGIAFDYQTFNYGGITAGLGVPSDHRFFLSFTLAGIGNFSPFNGAMSGVPH